jgi:hypothetical protein
MIDDRQGLFVVDGIFQTLIYLFIYFSFKQVNLSWKRFIS